MNKNILTLALVCMFMILFAPHLTYAQGSLTPTIVAWTDNAQYVAGQTGKLSITYYNNRNKPITIRNITITYEGWKAHINGAWVGNDTYKPKDTEKSVSEHSARTFEISFTVPSDGRARTTSLTIIVYTTEPVPDSLYTADIRVAEKLVYMEQVVTLFTILVVLVIVCTIIMAATIFLSARRPQVVWSREEKAA